MFWLVVFSFLAGFVTVLSPCILPVLPLLLAAGADGGRSRAWGIVTGLVLSFAFFTLFLTFLVHLTGISPDWLRYGAIALIILFGLMLIFPELGNRFQHLFSRISALGNFVQNQSSRIGSPFWGGFIMGIALGLIWTPCAGPILGTITTLVATGALSLSAVIITCAYSMGAAVPMFFIIYGGQKIIGASSALSRYSEIIRKIFGILMIVGALAIAFHADIYLQQLTIRYFPTISFEHNDFIKKELAAMAPNQNSAFTFAQGNEPKAPDFVGIEAWINSEPLSLSQLRGKVVLVDFWTYSCINCVRTLPYLKQWYEKYKDKNFVIVGVHTPEFEFEKKVSNVQSAVKRFGIMYPVALDNEYKTWQQYNNRYWPAHYLIDQEGVVKERHFGEGGYSETENALRALLHLAPLASHENVQMLKSQTPETYLGYARASAYGPEIVLKNDLSASYDYKNELPPDRVGLKGQWIIAPEYITADADGATIEINFSAEHIYLVMQSPDPKIMKLLLDGKPVPAQYQTPDMQESSIKVYEPRMYDILNLKNKNGRHKLTLQFPAGVSAYAFTFG